jgi:hypothetical protein
MGVCMRPTMVGPDMLAAELIHWLPVCYKDFSTRSSTERRMTMASCMLVRHGSGLPEMEERI